MKKALACSVMKIGFVVGVLSESVMILGGLEESGGSHIQIQPFYPGFFYFLSFGLSLCFVGCSESGEVTRRHVTLVREEHGIRTAAMTESLGSAG